MPQRWEDFLDESVCRKQVKSPSWDVYVEANGQKFFFHSFQTVSVILSGPVNLDSSTCNKFFSQFNSYFKPIQTHHLPGTYAVCWFLSCFSTAKQDKWTYCYQWKMFCAHSVIPSRWPLVWVLCRITSCTYGSTWTEVIPKGQCVLFHQHTQSVNFFSL